MPRPKITKRPSEPAPKTATNVVLWANLKALMTEQYGKENLTRLAREAKIGPGSATRIKNQQTAIGFDVLEKVARVFNLFPWQLLVPGLQPKDPPVLRVASEAEKTMYETAMRTRDALVDFIDQANTRPGGLS